MSGDGWIWTDGHIIGSLESWSTSYGWNGKSYPTQRQAIAAGLLDYGSDDFNVAHLSHGFVDWWGWMDQSHHLEDAQGFADEHGLLLAGIPEP